MNRCYVLRSQAIRALVAFIFCVTFGHAVGDSPLLDVIVEPNDGQAIPKKVRGRIGMPDMGHWMTEETAVGYSGNGHQFASDFPHPGVYRLRIWIDYEDGTTIKTAVDFTIADGYDLVLEVVP